jgi:dipeptidyl aminopeptidase/acylaminoacyl peptidase
MLSSLDGSPQAKNAMPVTRRVAVADVIQMTRWADRDYFVGAEPADRVGLFSPDGRQFVIVLSKGKLERDVNEYSILLFSTDQVFRSPKSQLLLTLASSSNRAAITNVKWLRDSETIVFLGEKTGEIPEIYSLDVKTQRLKQLTHQHAPIVAYDITDDGEKIIYEVAARKTVDLFKSRRSGVVITTQGMTTLLTCDPHTDGENEVQDLELFLQVGTHAPSRTRFSGFLSQSGLLSLSPTGRYALFTAYAQQIPSSWADYRDVLLHPYVVENRKVGTPSNVQQYMLLDTNSEAVVPLVDGPMSWFNNSFAWNRNGTAIVVSGIYLPLSVSDATERDAREKNAFVVEVKLPSKEIVKITEKEMRVALWSLLTGHVLLEWRTASHVHEFEAFGGNNSTWRQVPLLAEDTLPRKPLEITLEEDSSTPPRFFVKDPKSRRKIMLFDPNPQFARLRFGAVEVVNWKATDGHDVMGGLYLPPDFRRGKRYPLVIQTHGFRKDRFWIDGPYSSAFAAQPLAAEGIVVLQVGSPSDPIEELKYFDTPAEAPRQEAVFEGAVDYLDSRGLIDRTYVGIIGFSRTVFHVEYALTHSKYRFRAVSLADGFDGGYINYLLWQSPDYVSVNGGPPEGSTLASWLQNSPGFNLERVGAAVRMEYYGRGNFLGGWQWFSGLSLLEKPVEFIWLPFGAHLLVKPSERMTSLQGNVDWFAFWLKGEEDTRPLKKDQYDRWKELRILLNRSCEKSHGVICN